MKTLVIDDNAIVLESVKRLLVDEGYECDCFSLPEEAIACYKQKRHDVVITDYLISEISGLLILRQVKSINPEAKVIVISGFSDVKDTVIKEGAYKYLQKPLDAFILLQTIHQISTADKREPQQIEA